MRVKTSVDHPRLLGSIALWSPCEDASLRVKTSVDYPHLLGSDVLLRVSIATRFYENVENLEARTCASGAQLACRSAASAAT